MTRAFAERESGPVVHAAPCVGCGTVSEERLCGDCAARAGEAAEHPYRCDCRVCRFAERVVTGLVLS